MIKGICIGDISIDCKDTTKLRDFYANLLGWTKKTIYGCPAAVAENGLIILFQGCEIEYVPPVWPEEAGKQQKQIHFNFQIDDLPSAVKQAEELGAVKAASQYGGAYYVTMLDPEGHPFCLCAKA